MTASDSDTTTLDPYIEGKIQVKFDTKYQFCLEHGYIDADEAVSRNDLNQIIMDLPPVEKSQFRSRLTKRLNRYDEIVEADQPSFDEPHIEHEDLVDGVFIPNFNR